MAMNRCTKEAKWLRQLIKDVGCIQEEAATIICDKQSSMVRAKNPINYYRSKHIYMQYHFIKIK